MQFYLVVPLLIHLIKKLNIIILTISILTVSVFASFSTQSITQSVMPYLIFFFIGMLIWETKPVTSTKTLINSFIVIIGVIIIHYSVPFLRDAIFIKKTIVGNINYVFYFYNLLPLLFIPMIIFSLNQKSDVADRRLGDLSYTVYLFHWLPFCIYSYYFSNNFLELRLIAFGGYILILSVGSYLIYNLFEKKLELWRKNLFVKN
jgi:peptidoglycan/LPS O-acetylase OafA/YrhL